MSSPISTPEQAQMITDLSQAQLKAIRSYFGINDFPYQEDKIYIVFDADAGDNDLHLIDDAVHEYSISKGDGTLPSSYNDSGGTKTLNYAVAGRYLITIEGTINGIVLRYESEADKAKYIDIFTSFNPGTNILSATKNGINHDFGVKLSEGKTFTAYSSGTIFKGDQIIDYVGSAFDVRLKDKYIPYMTRFKVEIKNGLAYVNIDDTTNIFDGMFVSKFGSSGTGDGQFQNPREIAVTDSNIYVVDADRYDVQIFDLSGTFVSKFGSNGTGDGQFQNPHGIAVTDSNIYVVDYDRDDVQIFDLNGTFVSKFGSSGTGDGQFQNPRGIAVTDSNIYVVDYDRDDVQIFDLSGTFISKFGSSGTGDGQFQSPTGIAVTDSNIYIVDSVRDNVQIFDLSGTFVSKFGSYGTGDGQFLNPIGIAVTDSNICVFDYSASPVRVVAQIFDLSGTFISKFGSSGTGDGQFQNPRGIAVTDSNIYVADAGRDDIQIFS